ncbi:MAG: type IV pilus assembly protein PilM [Deltaproteobacteria bacterium]|nr:type IV pilus assembly protein PilM [Deltaproteobacteria bacterium]
MSEGKYLVGIDIGSSAIKLCHLKDVKGRRTLVKFGYQPLPPQTIVDGQVMNQGAIVEALNKLYADTKERLRDVALSISGHSVIIKRLTLPLLDAQQLAEQIPWEAEQQIPFEIKDVHLDYEILRKRPEQGQMDVLLVAAKLEELAAIADVARQAKLRPVTIDVDAFAVQNIFEVNYGLPTEGTFALINVGATLTTINIISNGIPAFTRDIANGGQMLTEEIQRQLNISFDEAEIYKSASPETLTRGAIVPSEIPKIIKQVVESLAGEVQRSLDFYLATSGEREIQQVFLTGGASSLPELGAAIERRAHCKLESINAFREIQVDGDINQDLLRQRASQATVALGLALRRDREKR